MSAVDLETRTRPGRPYLGREGAFRLQKRRAVDHSVTWIVRFGGALIIVSILGILLFLLAEVVPLWRGARLQPLRQAAVSSDSRVLAIGLDEQQEIGYWLDSSGAVKFFSVAEMTQLRGDSIDVGSGVELTAVWQSLRLDRLAVGTGTGQAIDIRVDYNPRFADGGRTYDPVATEVGRRLLDPEGRPIALLAVAGDAEEGLTLAAVTEDGRLLLVQETVTTSLFGPPERQSVRYDLTQQLVGTPSALAIDELQENLYVGTLDGRIIHFDLASAGRPTRLSVIPASSAEGAAITQLKFLIGGRSMAVCDAAGGVAVWFRVRDNTAPSGWRLRRVHPLEDHDAPITATAASGRNRSLLTADEKGTLLLHYSTTERTLGRVKLSPQGLRLLAFAPKGNGFLGLDERGYLYHGSVNNPHPEASWRAFFGKIWYEGYDKPEYVWQSTGGTDDFEPKLSLIPLIFGTLKGTFYSLIIAVPLAILAALYTSQFMKPNWRNRVKPTIEIMAALPSVVLGFLAGLWLAPLVADYLPGLFLSAVALPPVVLLMSALWRAAPSGLRSRFREGHEVWLLMPVVIALVVVCLRLNDPLSVWLFGGDFKAWLFETLNWHYDQRNALVVGFAMGFAVIPIIFTISEDSLSNVPGHLVAGSLALGATRWQTAVRVVLPTASAGIFSAVMIGFGRAVGETMIVLMATGNTPIMDWNLFNGFRTLSANIAVEIPEAPVGGTLYRVLFLSALVLFAMTFVVNTLAEVVRQRVRQRYGKL